MRWIRIPNSSPALGDKTIGKCPPDFEVTLDEQLPSFLHADFCFVSPIVDCDECDGKVTELTLKYNGNTSDAFIEVFQKKAAGAVFAGTVQPDGQFTFVGVDKKGTLGTEISVYVDGNLQHQNSHELFSTDWSWS